MIGRLLDAWIARLWSGPVPDDLKLGNLDRLHGLKPPPPPR